MGILRELVECTDGWSYVGEKRGVRVERRAIGAGPYVSAVDAAKGSKHACVKSSAVLDASPESVFQLFADNSRVKEFNEHCLDSQDVHLIPRGLGLVGGGMGLGAETWTKVAWSATPTYGIFKARDFLSVVNYTKYPNGTYVVLNRPGYLSSHAPRSRYVRATILLAGNVIRPHGHNQTLLTTVAQINPGGVSDTPAAAWVIN
ncbi:hypothetical protein B484DRAFT_338933, partial [Ochromonadaceae sp. CCMP2298]